MSNRNPSGRKPKQSTIKVTLMDLSQMELVLPPIFNGLQMKVVVEFDGKSTKLGLRANGVKFDHDWKELQQFQGLSGVVNRLTAEVKENRGKELALAVMGKAHEEKVLDAMSQKLLMFTQKGEQLDKLKEEVEKRVVTTPLEIECKKVVLELCKDIQSVIAIVKEKPKDFDFQKELTEVGIPTALAERMSSPGYSTKDKDLLSVIFPADPRMHLALTLAEIENGGLHRFMGLLLPQNGTFLWYLLKKFIPEQKGSLTEPKVAKFKWRFIPPMSIAQMWKNRDKVMYREQGGSPAYQLEAQNMAFYGAATQLINAPYPVLSQMREYLWGFKPSDAAEARARAPEKPVDPGLFKQKFYSDFLEQITDEPSVTAEFKEDILPPRKPIPEKDWKIDTKGVPKIERKKRELSFQKGTFPVRGKESDYLLRDIEKTRYKQHRSALSDYLTNYKGEVQEHIARVLYARLITGLVDVGVEPIDEDAHQSDDEYDEDD